MDDASFDSGLIGAALRTEHYEVAGYTACIAMAHTLELNDAIELLQQNLDEELAAAEKIKAASEAIFQQAMNEEEEDEDSEPESKKPAKEKAAETEEQGRREGRCTAGQEALLEGRLASFATTRLPCLDP